MSAVEKANVKIVPLKTRLTVVTIVQPFGLRAQNPNGIAKVLLPLPNNV